MDLASQVQELIRAASTPELAKTLQLASDHALSGRSPEAFLDALGVPGFVTGYVNHSVPAAIFLWLRHDSFESAMAEAVRMGGDTDTVAAMAGALIGGTMGYSSIPARWVSGLGDSPITVLRLLALADALAVARTGIDAGESDHELPWLRFLLRNLGMIGLVSFHVFWRRLPRLGNGPRSR